MIIEANASWPGFTIHQIFYTSLSAVLTYVNISHQINLTYSLAPEAQEATKQEHDFWIAKTQEAYYSDFTLRYKL